MTPEILTYSNDSARTKSKYQTSFEVFDIEKKMQITVYSGSSITNKDLKSNRADKTVQLSSPISKRVRKMMMLYPQAREKDRYLNEFNYCKRGSEFLKQKLDPEITPVHPDFGFNC